MSGYYGDGNSYRGVVCRESQTPTIVYRSGDEVVTLLEQRIRELEAKYNELLMAVQKKHPEKTRHQTALRYIQEREAACHGPSQALEQPR